MIGAELFCDCFLTGVEAFLIKSGIAVLFLRLPQGLNGKRPPTPVWCGWALINTALTQRLLRNLLLTESIQLKVSGST